MWHGRRAVVIGAAMQSLSARVRAVGAVQGGRERRGQRAHSIHLAHVDCKDAARFAR